MRTSRVLFTIALPLLSFAASVPEHAPEHREDLETRLPASWDHPQDHPAYALFRRAAQTDGTVYATVGSSQWSAPYPPSKPDPSQYPQAWIDALNAAVAAGKIPNIPPSTMASNGLPVYPSGLSATGPVVCSSTYQCQNSTTDIWNAPDGVFGAGFDDGPLPTSTALYEFLHENKVRATHFMIGVNIIQNPNEFTMAFETNNDDIAVHTWTHPYMTSLDNLQLLGEFGWTMQLIHNSTGGRLPRFWRPPYGDADNRVRAIAKEIFGLTTIIWNHDTADWSLTTGGTTPAKVHSSLEQWLTGPKSPGLIILEHELSNLSVQAFISAFPLIKQNGWNFVSVTELDGADPYQNADSSTSTVEPVDGIIVFSGAAPQAAASINVSSSSTSSSTLSQTSPSSPSPSSTNTALTVTTTHAPNPTNVGAQKSNGSARSCVVSWRMVKLVTAFALIGSGVSLV